MGRAARHVDCPEKTPEAADAAYWRTLYVRGSEGEPAWIPVGKICGLCHAVRLADPKPIPKP